VVVRPHGYGRQTLRLPGYDYRSPGAYFVTIVTYGRQLRLADPAVEEIVRVAWRRAIRGGQEPDPYDFVVMPNHVHGIVWLPAKRNVVLHPTGVGVQRPSQPISSQSRGKLRFRERSLGRGAAPLPRAGSLGAVVRAFKASAALRINVLHGTPGLRIWQRGYFERVIRTESELERVREYIADNPRKWREDRLNPLNSPAQTAEWAPL
jgi:REP element-mobilizing transposase RayT